MRVPLGSIVLIAHYLWPEAFHAFTICIYARSFRFPPLALDKKVITAPPALRSKGAHCFLPEELGNSVPP